jgi:hypothetical protein
MIRLVIAVICIFLFACTNPQELPQEPPNAAQTQPKPNGTKLPDPELVEEPTDAWKKKNGCDKGDQSFMKIEKQYITPESPQRGLLFKHHFIYVVCVSDAQSLNKGSISRKITHKNKLVFESKNDFEIKSGKWEHVANINTPKEIDPGKYKFLLSISILNTIIPSTPRIFEIRK